MPNNSSEKASEKPEKLSTEDIKKIKSVREKQVREAAVIRK